MTTSVNLVHTETKPNLKKNNMDLYWSITKQNNQNWINQQENPHLVNLVSLVKPATKPKYGQLIFSSFVLNLVTTCPEIVV